MESEMKHIVICTALLLAAIAPAQAAPQSIALKRTRPAVTVYNRDSRNPAVGWHTENGMRVCHYDCDNPEIPGSGARCRNVNFMGMPMRECVTGSSL
jgi:hypothetical protein